MKYKFETKDKQEAKDIMKVNDYILALNDIANHIRKHVKYIDMEKPIDYDELQEIFYNILNDHDIDLWD